MNIFVKLTKAYNRIYPLISGIRGATRFRHYLEKKCFDSALPNIAELEIKNEKLAAPLQGQSLRYFIGMNPEPTLDYCIENVREDEKFVDVGGAYGLYSAILSSKNSCECITYEPNPINLGFLRINKHIYGYDMEIREQACANSEGSDRFFMPKSEFDKGSIGNQSHEGSNSITKEVEMVKLDKEVSNVDWLKIDVEGASKFVLEGAEKIMERERPIILLELHSNELMSKFNSSKEEVVRFLNARNYDIYELDRELHLKKYSRTQDDSNDNLICLPK